MGVIYIREENPWAEFIQGLTPMATAWGNRYIQRDIENTRNDKNDGNNAEENSNSEYFFNVRDLRDTSDTPYFTPSSTPPTSSQGTDSLFNYRLRQLPSTMSVTPYSVNQMSSQPVQLKNLRYDINTSPMEFYRGIGRAY